jgi:4-diphosphocytidyl-2-C-methyl-D-erythritol kinase
VNLALGVTGRRPDGFHTLRSVFGRLALHDDLDVSIGRLGSSDTLEVVGDPECPVEGNLVLRAAAAVRALDGRPLPGLAFRLEKRIPVAAGLAGGSADAAAALDLAARAWAIGLAPDERLALALRLGADVPFFASDVGAAVVDGVGDRLRPLRPPHPPAGVLLVTPRQRLATATVFAAYDRLARAPSSADRRVVRLADGLDAGLTGAGLVDLASELRDANDLWPAAVAVMPTLGPLREDLEAALERPVLLTGSGSTLVALYPSPDAAAEAATQLTRSGRPTLDGARVIATRTDGEAAA